MSRLASYFKEKMGASMGMGKTKQNIFIILSLFSLSSIEKMAFATAGDTVNSRESCVELLGVISGESRESLRNIFTNSRSIKKFRNTTFLKIHPDKCKAEDKKKCEAEYKEFNECLTLLEKKPTPNESKTNEGPSGGVKAPKETWTQYFKNKSHVCYIRHDNKPTCDADAERCVWDEISHSCLDRTYSTCYSAGGGGACEKIKGCVWDEHKFSCLSTYTSTCADSGQEKTCSQLGCTWDDKAHSCLSTTVSKCSSAQKQDTCHAMHGCSWDQVGKFCMNPLLSSCSTAKEADSCGTIYNCIWDTGAKSCLSKTSSMCKSANDSNTCGNILGCIWDPSNKCINSWVSQCKTATVEDSCKGIGTCIWDATSNHCLSYIETCGASTNSDRCGAHSGCVWDNGNKSCLSKGYSWCNWAGEENACKELGCKWKGKTKTCVQKSSGSIRFHNTTPMDPTMPRAEPLSPNPKH